MEAEGGNSFLSSGPRSSRRSAFERSTASMTAAIIQPSSAIRGGPRRARPGVIVAGVQLSPRRGGSHRSAGPDDLRPAVPTPERADPNRDQRTVLGCCEDRDDAEVGSDEFKSPAGTRPLPQPQAQEIADCVYAYVQPDGTWWINNCGFVTGPGGVIAVDSCSTEARTRQYLDGIQRRHHLPRTGPGEHPQPRRPHQRELPVRPGGDRRSPVLP